MTTRIIDLTKINLEQLISLVRGGTEIILTEDDTPVARLLPMAGGRVAGLDVGSITTTDDFDAPLPESFWLPVHQENA